MQLVPFTQECPFQGKSLGSTYRLIEVTPSKIHDRLGVSECHIHFSMCFESLFGNHDYGTKALAPSYVRSFVTFLAVKE